MNEKIDELLEVLFNLLDDSKLVNSLKYEKNEIFKDKLLLEKIETLRNMDIYSTEYQALKKDLFTNEHYVNYKEKEVELNYLILEINRLLKPLTSKRGCIHENN